MSLDCPKCGNTQTQRGAPGGWKVWHLLADLFGLVVTPIVLWIVMMLIAELTVGPVTEVWSNCAFFVAVAFTIFCLVVNWIERTRRDAAQYCPRCSHTFAASPTDASVPS